MRVLAACEKSGVVRDAFIKRGHRAISCDIDPSITPGPHYQGDVRDIIEEGWDLIIAHPPCTYLAVSGNAHYADRPDLYLPACEFAKMFIQYAPRVAIENPVGRLSTLWRKPDQYIQPYQFGHDASKKTGLWLKNLPSLVPTKYISGRLVGGKERWGNQTDSGQNKLTPSEDRAEIRSKTYEGIADAMADQWG